VWQRIDGGRLNDEAMWILLVAMSALDPERLLASVRFLERRSLRSAMN
jgi:hypothetical protein